MTEADKPPEPDQDRWFARPKGAHAERFRWTPATVGLAIGLIGVIAVVVTLLVRGGEVPQTSPVEPALPAPAEGLACSHLAEASQLLDAGDDEGFRAAVRAAGQAGRRTLDTSGEKFGAPERAAIDLEFALQGVDVSSPQVEQLLAKGRKACIKLGEWPAA